MMPTLRAVALSVAASLACLALFAACRSSSSSIDALYAELEDEVRGADPLKGPGPSVAERRIRRADAVHAIAARSELLTAEDYFEAAMLLVETARPDDLVLAETCARKSAQLGEPNARRVEAEAVDKRLLLADAPQKYGTQYVFEWVLDSWRLYPVDVRTTDAERAAMGVPDYAELLHAEDEMNRVHQKKPRPR